MTFRGAVRAELIKAVHRPAAWIVLLLPNVGWLTFSYWRGYRSALEGLRAGAEVPEGVMPPDMLLGMYLPAEYVIRVADNVSTTGPISAVVFAILFVGSEYGNDTLKTSIMHTARRGTFFAAKASAVLIGVVGAVAGVFLLAAALSSVVALLFGSSPLFSPPAVFASGFALTTVGLAGWALVGVFLATLLRGTALPIAVVLLYDAAQGPIAGRAFASGETSPVLETMLGANARVVLLAVREHVIVAGVDIPLARALATVAAYALVAILASAWLVRRRDVL